MGSTSMFYSLFGSSSSSTNMCEGYIYMKGRSSGVYILCVYIIYIYIQGNNCNYFGLNLVSPGKMNSPAEHAVLTAQPHLETLPAKNCRICCMWKPNFQNCKKNFWPSESISFAHFPPIFSLHRIHHTQPNTNHPRYLQLPQVR